ncbi:MAG: phosphotransferase [Lachnospiraceae bacterium]|nr:phosphotransferase [Lachnospiraceae bacterium]
MNEREWEVLQQYDMQVRKITRFRGAFLCETGREPYLLKECAVPEERLQWEAWILERCRNLGGVRTETYVCNREGRLLSRSSDYRYYLLRTWQEGRECSRDDREDVLLAAGALAQLHKNFRQMKEELAAWEVIWRQEWEQIRQEEQEAARQREEKRREENGIGLRVEEENRTLCTTGEQEPDGSERQDPAENPANGRDAGRETPENIPASSSAKNRTAAEMHRHTREMTRARNFIRKIRRKSELELVLLSEFANYLPQAEEATCGMEALAPAEDGLCHGDYACHHLFRGNDGLFLSDFGRLHHGVYQEDLYLLLRKTMENSGWDAALAREMLTRYDRIFPLSPELLRYLYPRFLNPDKFWKQVNFYYNHRKSWMPARNLEKLRAIAAQKEGREAFLHFMEENIDRM